MILYFNRASHGGQGTGKLGVRAIARSLDKSPFVAGQAGLDQLPHEPLELGVGGFFGPFHKRGIANHVCRQDGSQPPLNTLLGQGGPL
jgi:hypothetical protein